MADYVKTGAETLVNTTTASDQYGSLVTQLDSGNYVVAWSIGGYLPSKAQLFASDGSKIGAEITVNSSSVSGGRVTSLTALSGGGFVIGWSDESGVTNAYVRAFGDDGAPVGAEIEVEPSTSTNDFAPAVAGLSDGGFVAVWQAFGDNPAEQFDAGTFGRRYDAAGNPVGTRFLVNTQVIGYQTQAKVVGLANGGYVVSWTDFNTAVDGSETATRAQVFAADGSRIGGEIAVNATTAGSQMPYDMIALADGGFAVHFSSTSRAQQIAYSSRVQFFDAAGAKVGTEHDLGAPAGSFVQLADGSFMLAYASDATGPETYVRHYDPALAPLGEAVMTNTRIPGSQFSPDVAVIAGGFVVTYTTSDSAVDGSGWAVLMQRFRSVPGTPSDGDDILFAPDGGAWIVNGGRGNDDMTGAAGDDRMNGGQGNDVMRGGAGDDRLNGGAGDDTLYGGSGRDVLSGSDGDDRLVGGTGRDVMSGGAGHDIFAFTQNELANGEGEIDARIFDFHRAEGDHIDLSAIDAVAGGQNDAFTFIDGASFSGTRGELRVTMEGGYTFLLGDTDGNGVADLVIRFDGAPAVAAADLTL